MPSMEMGEKATINFLKKSDISVLNDSCMECRRFILLLFKLDSNWVKLRGFITSLLPEKRIEQFSD